MDKENRSRQQKYMKTTESQYMKNKYIIMEERKKREEEEKSADPITCPCDATAIKYFEKEGKPVCNTVSCSLQFNRSCITSLL